MAKGKKIDLGLSYLGGATGRTQSILPWWNYR